MVSEPDSENLLYKLITTKQNELRGLSPRASYTDRATAASQRS
jgi:hypothetical protein